ncbi:hypothetical protein AX15_005347, partial [Amanita polypyramis BW_CC]
KSEQLSILHQLTKDNWPVIDEVELAITLYTPMLVMPFFMNKIRSIRLASAGMHESGFAFLGNLVLPRTELRHYYEETSMRSLARSHFLALSDSCLTVIGAGPLALIKSSRKKYNFSYLERLLLFSCTIPLSIILKDVPKLRFSCHVIVDDEAITGISTGQLGRCLTKLRIGAHGNAEEILNMLEVRHRKAARIIRNSRSSEEDVNIMRVVEVDGFGQVSGAACCIETFGHFIPDATAITLSTTYCGS